MGNVFTPFHYVVNHHQDEALPHNDPSPKTHPANTGAPGMIFSSHEHTATNPWDILPQITWEQCWSPDHNLFTESPEVARSRTLTYREPQLDTQCAYEPEDPEQRTSPAISMSENAILSPGIMSSYLEMSLNSSERPQGSTLAQSYEQKRKRIATQPTPTKVTSHSLTQKRTTKAEASGRKSIASSKARLSLDHMDANTLATTQGESPVNYRERIRERNRTASVKLRLKQRESLKRLQANEEEMEQVNADLASWASDLTTQVYQLKMELLQHASCDCELIQTYIASEANQYIGGLGDTKQSSFNQGELPHIQRKRAKS